MTQYRKKLIEVALPLDAINAASAREKSIRHGHPSTLHLWWARRPLAACRAVLFAQLVDDPSSWPDRFPTEADQERERQRLFGIIERMVPWEASTDEAVLNEARLEIARSWARSHPCSKAAGVLAEGVSADTIDEYLATQVPPVHDPFAGGGSIPLEAQRLGLRVIATDLNPVAVLINKALVEVAPRFFGEPPANPDDSAKADLASWTGARGLADDIRYYGEWMRARAVERIGHLYPEVVVPAALAERRADLKGMGGRSLTVIAWLWARTVPSPDPAAGGAHVPLVSNFWLSKKKGKEAWVEVVRENDGKSYRFDVRTGVPRDRKAIGAGTKIGRGSFRCVLTGTPIPVEYIRSEAQAGRLGAKLMAVVGEGRRRRIYLPPSDAQDEAARGARPEWEPDQEFEQNALGFRVGNYGLSAWSDLFSPRQTVALGTFAALIGEVRQQVRDDAVRRGLSEDGTPLHAGGNGATAYADAVALYLSFAISRSADFWATLCIWSPAAKNELVMHVFGKQTVQMTWDYGEVNPFSNSGGNWGGAVGWVAKVAERLNGTSPAVVEQRDAASPDRGQPQRVFSTDPPYYDNIGYADLSDFFYVWTRRALREVFPEETSTMLVPKDAELVATPCRHGGRQEAEQFFLEGMTRAVSSMCRASDPATPTAIYYAFKQTETSKSGTSSTGWETFLDAVQRSGFSVVGTWPIRTERPGRMRATNSNALATSVVLVCRSRQGESTTTRGDLRRSLRRELPAALRALQHAGIAPVDMAQAAIGPGMAAFTRHERVLEADGSPMTVRAALQLINEVLDEHLAEGEGDYDADTRWALTWFEHHGYEAGAYGEAESLAKARNVSVRGVAEAGIIKSAVGSVRVLRRDEMGPLDYDPAEDDRPTVWEYTQHLIRNLEQKGEAAAANLLKKLGSDADAARSLAYRLYSVCERRKWAEEARAYNGLVVAWPELERLAASQPSDIGQPQQEIFD